MKVLRLFGWAVLVVHTVVSAQPPAYFTMNVGQWDCSAEFQARVPGGHLRFNSQSLDYVFIDQDALTSLHHRAHGDFQESEVATETGTRVGARWVRVNLVDASRVGAKPFGRQPFVHHYFRGAEESEWRSNVENFSGVLYPSIYNGIDLKIYTSGSYLKYDLLVSAGADPGVIKLNYQGAIDLRLRDGDLLVDGEFAQVREKMPVAYQIVDGEKKFVPCHYQLIGNELSFRFPEGYDPCHELVIDPILIFSTYSGSTADNWGSTATPGEHGMLYSAGVTNESSFQGDFPATPGAFQVDYGGLYDVGILKYDSLGQQLIYASFLGGAQSESPHSLIMNENEELVVLGTTSSANFPTTASAFDRTYNGGTNETNVIQYNNGSDIFVARLSADGSQLLASTLLGGSANDGMNPTSGVLTANYGDQLRGDVIVDDAGDIIISTVTSSANFPVQNSFGLSYRGGTSDALIVKLRPDLSEIVWAAFFGGSGADASHTIKIDETGNIFFGGGTTSNNLPTTSGAYQHDHQGGVDGWIAKITPDGQSLMAATYTGTTTFNQVYFIELNANNEVYAYGQTVGSNFPYTPGAFRNPNSGQFLQKFSNDLQTLLVSTVFGSGRGIPDISPTAFLVNDCNNIYMTGWGGAINQSQGFWQNNTVGMPISGDAFQASTSGSDFYFMVLTDDASDFLYGTYMGGNSSRTHVDGGTSRFDKGGIVYHAVCAGCQAGNVTGQSTSDFPTTAGAWSNTNNSPNCNNAAFKFDLSSLRARILTNSLKLDKPGLTQICFPDTIVFQNKSTGGEMFVWDFGDGTSEVKTDTLSIPHQYPGAGEYIIKLKAIDEGTCVGKDSTSVTIRVDVPTGFVGGDRAICSGELTQLTAGGGVQYRWVSEDDSLSFDTAQPVVSPRDTLSFFVDVTDGNGCVVRDTVTVNVVPRIDLDFDYVRTEECNDRAYIRVINKSTPGAEDLLFFDFGDGTTSDLPEVTHRYEADGDYNVRLVGVRDQCVFESAVLLPFYYLKVPNVITPDAKEGKNDTFKILYGDQPAGTSDLRVHLRVFNRWGRLVFEDDHYKDNWAAPGLSGGIYYYEIALNGQPTCRNWLQIVK